MNRPQSAEAPREERAEATISKLRSDGGQRREHARYKVDLDVSVGSEHNFYSGFAENLSAGGVFVATHLVKPVGERVEISINLAGSASAIRGVGEVRWVREYNAASDTPPGMGIRFIDLEPGAEAQIGGFLATREPLFYDDEL